MESIILLGFGGHARSVADSIIQSGQFHIEGYTGDRPEDCSGGFRWLGTDSSLEKHYKSGIHNAFISIGYMGGGKGNIRDRLYATAKKIGYRFPVIADHTAAIAGSAVIGEGTYIGKCAVVNADACVGKMCIINSCALVEHGSVVGDYSHIAVKAALCGNVHTGDHVFIGAGATVIQGTGIGAGSIVGAGSLVLGDIPIQQTVYGVYKNR